MMDDFESSPEYQVLVATAAGKPERAMGASVIPAEPPNWKEVLKQAKALSKTAPDQLVLHVYIIQSEAHVNGFAGLHRAFANVLQFLSEQWDSLSPAPDLDDPDDMYYERINLMRELSDKSDFLAALYRQPVVQARGIGVFSARDIDIALGRVNGSEEELARCQDGLVRGAFAESDPAELQATADALAELPALCQQAEDVFTEKSGQSGVLTLDGLHRQLEACRSCFLEFAADSLQADNTMTPDSEAAESIDSADAPSDSASTDVGGRVLRSSLPDRQAVRAAFQALEHYYQCNEPSSPVLLLTRQVCDLIDRPFFEVLQIMAPMHRDDLPVLVTELQKQPLAALLVDAFARYLQDASTLNTDSASTVANDIRIAVPESRDEVIALMQDIEAFFTVHEPSSPVPLVLGDVRRLVHRSFTEIVAEFARLIPQTEPAANE